MIQEEIFTLEREFSDIAPFQKAFRARYVLVLRQGKYVAQLQYCSGKDILAQEAVLDCEQEPARRIVRFLYENAIPMENWKDILCELKSQLKTNG